LHRKDHATVDQLRHEIDQGNTGDKVRSRDPAAVPLGTDEEAAGTPIDGALIARVLQRELVHRVHDNRTSQEFDWKAVGAWVFIVTVLALAVGIALAVSN